MHMIDWERVVTVEPPSRIHLHTQVQPDQVHCHQSSAAVKKETVCNCAGSAGYQEILHVALVDRSWSLALCTVRCTDYYQM